MKRLAPYIVIAILAAAIVLYQPFATFGADDFVMKDGYKIFTYGFPFRIVDCNERLPMHMSNWQMAMRFGGNFAVFFTCGLLFLQALRRFRKSRTGSS